MPSPSINFINQIICGDAGQILRQLPNESIDCVVTSPPYWSLRDYGVRGQIGLEPTISGYITRLCDVFAEVKRVLKEAGTCWVNIGDTFFGDSIVRQRSSEQFGSGHEITLRRSAHSSAMFQRKCLAQIPSRFALEMIDHGWILRNEIIWHKPNCMPASVKDRFTVDFEKLFFFVKSPRYYFEQQFEELRDRGRSSHRLVNPQSKKKRLYGDKYISAINPQSAEASRLRILARGRNKRCVWRIATKPFFGRHFAVYPQALIETPIKAGCPKGGIVLDPFLGSGTTALVAKRLGRQFIGIDLNPRYVRMARRRLLSAG